jgi:hypothetical protein
MQGIGFLVRERVFHQGSWGYSDLPFFVCAFGSGRLCQSLPPRACGFFQQLDPPQAAAGIAAFRSDILLGNLDQSCLLIDARKKSVDAPRSPRPSA